MTELKIRRNQLCPCGSGKKYKKCCLNKSKERQNCLIVDFGKPTKVDGVGITKDGHVDFIQDGHRLKVEGSYYHSFYDRTKSPKILNRIDLKSNEINTNTIFSNYDRIFTIDTNSKKINDQNISASGIVLCKVTPAQGGALALFAPVQCLEFRNIDSNQERVAWKHLFELMVSHPLYTELTSIAVVVDAHLGEIPAYNLRKKPIIGDYFLPSKIELIYASSDVGKEYLPNRLISMADKTATELLNHILVHDKKSKSLCLSITFYW